MNTSLILAATEAPLFDEPSTGERMMNTLGFVIIPILVIIGIVLLVRYLRKR